MGKLSYIITMQLIDSKLCMLLIFETNDMN